MAFLKTIKEVGKTIQQIIYETYDRSKSFDQYTVDFKKGLKTLKIKELSLTT